MYKFLGVNVYQNNDATTNTTATARNYLLVEHVPTASSNYLRKHGPADNQENGPGDRIPFKQVLGPNSCAARPPPKKKTEKWFAKCW